MISGELLLIIAVNGFGQPWAWRLNYFKKDHGHYKITGLYEFCQQVSDLDSVNLLPYNF